MLVYTYLIFEAFLCVMLGASYSKKNEVLWGMSAVLAGVLASLSTSIDFVYNEGGKFLSIPFNDNIGMLFNLAVMIVATTFFFLDAYSNYGNPLMFYKRFKKDKKGA